MLSKCSRLVNIGFCHTSYRLNRQNVFMDFNKLSQALSKAVIGRFKLGGNIIIVSDLMVIDNSGQYRKKIHKISDGHGQWVIYWLDKRQQKQPGRQPDVKTLREK
jgi:hypothetical protein